jgi:hypothetical protein
MFVLTYILATLITLTFYEMRFIPSDKICKSTGRHSAMYLTYQTILVLCFSLINTNNGFILVLINFLSSVFIFYIFRTNSAYYHKIAIAFWDCITGFLAYTAFFLIISYLMENYILKGLFIIWIVTSPIFLAIIATNPHD